MKQFDLRIIGLLVFISLTAGSLFANIYCSENVSELGAFNYDYIEKMQSMNINGRDLFQYVLTERLKVWGLLFLLSFTSIAGLIHLGYILSFGFLLGLTCSTMVMIHGFMGTIYFFFLCLISQMLYLGAVMAGMYGGMQRKKSKTGGNRIIFLVLTALVLLCFSAFAETALNLYFVKIFYK